MSHISDNTVSDNLKLDQKINVISEKISDNEDLLKNNENTKSEKEKNNNIPIKNTFNKKFCSREGCKKKLKLTDIECRCGLKFCSLHRYAEKHECTFNWKEYGKGKITNNNPVVIADKISKF